MLIDILSDDTTAAHKARTECENDRRGGDQHAVDQADDVRQGLAAFRRCWQVGGSSLQTAYLVHMLFHYWLLLGPGIHSHRRNHHDPEYYESLLAVDTRPGALVSVDRNSALRPTISARPIPPTCRQSRPPQC